MHDDAADKVWEAFQKGQATGFRGVPYYQRFGFTVNPFDPVSDQSSFWDKSPQLLALGATVGQHLSGLQSDEDLQGLHLFVVAPSGRGLSSTLLYLSDLLSKRGIETCYIDLHDLRFEEDNLKIFHPRTVPGLRSQFAKLEDSFRPQILFLDNAACFTDHWSLLVEEFWSSSDDQPLIVAGLSKSEYFFLKERVLHEDDEQARDFINFFYPEVFTLKPFNHAEMIALLEHRIKSSGSPPDWLFPRGVLKKIATLSLGIPRLACLIGDTLLQILNIQDDSRQKDPLTVLSTAAEFSIFHNAVDLLEEVGETLVFENTRYSILRQVMARAGAARMETGICMTRRELLSRNRSLINHYGVQPTHMGNYLPSKISYHLTTLAKANLLSVSKEGKRRFYYSTEPYSGVIENLID